MLSTSDMALFRNLAQNRFLDVALVAAALVIFAVVLPQRSRQNDFAHYYVSSRLLLDGQQPYGVPLAPVLTQYGFSDLDQDIELATNPPLLLWLFVPFALLPPTLAFCAWAVGEAICLATILCLTKKLLGVAIDVKHWRMFCAVVLISPPVFWHFYFSQVQLLLAVLVLLAFVCHRQGKHTRACLLVAAAGAIKLFPFALLPWFVWRGSRNWAEFAKRSAVSLAVVVAAVIVSGPSLWSGFFTKGQQHLLDWAMLWLLNFTIPSFVMTLTRIIAVEFAPTWDVDCLRPLASLAGFAFIGWAYWRCLRGSRNETAEFCLLSLAMLCGGVTAWVHYQVFLIFPFAVAAAQVAANPTRRKIILLALIALTVFVQGHLALVSGLPPTVSITLSFMPLYGMLLLTWYFGRQLRAHASVDLLTNSFFAHGIVRPVPATFDN